MTALRKTTAALISDAAPFAIRAERASDVAAREALLDACFGDNRHTRTCQRLRDGRAPAEGLALSAVRQGRLVGSVRLWHVSAGGIPALMLGPLAVEASSRQLGVGAALMDHALAAAKARGHRAVILLGDAPYYARFGFSAAKTGELTLPGAFERDRLLGLELREGALDGAWGMIAPTGAPLPKSKGKPRQEGAARAARGLMPCRRAFPSQCAGARPRFRSVITTVLLIMISVMIVGTSSCAAGAAPRPRPPTLPGSPDSPARGCARRGKALKPRQIR